MGRTLYKTQSEAIRGLKVGDIIMVDTKGILIPRLIQRVTHSCWSHVAMVFDVPPLSGTEHDVLIVESNADGIEIHRLNSYLRSPDKYILGFKRLKGLTDVERERFRGFFLDAVDTPYDFRRLAAFFLQSVVLWTVGMNIQFTMARKVINTQNYICTTFAQRAFYLAVAPEKRGKILFRSDQDAPNFLHQVEEVSPADVARSKNTVWLYNERY